MTITKKYIKQNRNLTRKLLKKKKSCEIPPGITLFEKNLVTKKFLRESKKYQKYLIKAFSKPFSPKSIRPQDDFYSYINYQWLQQKNIFTIGKSEYLVQIDDFRIVQDKVYHQLIDLIKEYVKHNDTRESRSVNNFYKSLLNNSANEKAMLKYAQNLISAYEIFFKKDNLWETLANINQSEIVNWGCPIYWSMAPDPKNPKIFRDSIYAPPLSLYDYNLYLEDYGQTAEFIKYKKEVKREYLKMIHLLFEKMLGKDNGLKPSDVFDVEYDMLLAMGCNTVKNDSFDYNKVGKKEAMELGFDWEQFCHYLGYDKAPEFFICGSKNYLKCICELLKKNWKTPKWKTYWYYIFLRQMIRFNYNLNDISFNFFYKFIKGQKEKIPQEVFPVFGLSLGFNTLMTNLYIEKYQNESFVKYVKILGEDLLEVFKRIITRNTWLSPSTKKYALLKLQHIKFIIGNPENARADPILDYVENDVWGNLDKLCIWKTKEYIRLSGKPVIDIPQIDWQSLKLIGKQAYIVNAFYTPLENGIYIPTAYLQEPFIDTNERGIEYNLARVGFTIGHEMSHSLDDLGSKYSYTGELKNWWTERDQKKFHSIINDIVKQYETFALRDGIEFDAKIGVGEDLADISGLAICNEYLRDFQVKNEDITPIKQLSYEAFYTYFAVQQRQRLASKKALVAQLLTNPHPFDKYRTNIPLSRLELFNKLYNIKPSDEMYWHSKNTVW